jgi:hypothetical protein
MESRPVRGLIADKGYFQEYSHTLLARRLMESGYKLRRTDLVSSVERGDALRIPEQSGSVRYVELVQTQRQKVPALKAAIEDLKAGRLQADPPSGNSSKYGHGALSFGRQQWKQNSHFVSNVLQ